MSEINCSKSDQTTEEKKLSLKIREASKDDKKGRERLERRDYVERK